MRVQKRHLIDVELRLASGHFSVAGAELADEVVAVKANTKSDVLPNPTLMHPHLHTSATESVMSSRGTGGTSAATSPHHFMVPSGSERRLPMRKG